MKKLKKCCNCTSNFFNLLYLMYANFLNPCRFLMNKGSKPWRTLGRSSQAVDVVVGKFLKIEFVTFLSNFSLLVFCTCACDGRNLKFLLLTGKVENSIQKKVSCGSVAEIRQWVNDDLTSTMDWLQQQDAKVFWVILTSPYT